MNSAHSLVLNKGTCEVSLKLRFRCQCKGYALGNKIIIRSFELCISYRFPLLILKLSVQFHVQIKFK